MTLLFVHQVDDKLDFLLSRVVNTSTQLSLFFIIFKIIFTKICEMENRKNLRIRRFMITRYLSLLRNIRKMLECMSTLEIYLENFSWAIPLIDKGEMHSFRPRL